LDLLSGTSHISQAKPVALREQFAIAPRAKRVTHTAACTVESDRRFVCRVQTVLEPFRPSWKQFGFLNGAPSRREGDTARSVAGKSSDELVGRRLQT